MKNRTLIAEAGQKGWWLGVLVALLAAVLVARGETPRRADKAEAEARWVEETQKRAEELRSDGWRLGRFMVPEDAADAVKKYEEAIALKEALARKEPENTRWLVDVAKMQGEMITINANKLDQKGQIAAGRASVATREKLVQREPGNAEWQSLLAEGYNDLTKELWCAGAAHGREAFLPMALESGRKGTALWEELVKSDPTNSDYQEGLMLSCVVFGAIIDPLAMQDESGKDPAYLPEAIASAHRMIALDNSLNGKNRWAAYQAFHLSELGALLRKQRDFSGAVEAFRKALAIREARVPDDRDDKSELIRSLKDLAEALKEESPRNQAEVRALSERGLRLLDAVKNEWYAYRVEELRSSLTAMAAK